MESSRNLALEKTLLLPEGTYVSLQAVGVIKEVKSTTRRPQFLSSYRASCVLVGKGREIRLFSPDQTCPKGWKKGQLYVVPNRNPRSQKYVGEACIRPDKPAWSGHHPPNEFFVFLRSGLRWMWYFLQSVWIVTASEWRWRFGQTTLKMCCTFILTVPWRTVYPITFFPTDRSSSLRIDEDFYPGADLTDRLLNLKNFEISFLDSNLPQCLRGNGCVKTVIK